MGNKWFGFPFDEIKNWYNQKTHTLLHNIKPVIIIGYQFYNFCLFFGGGGLQLNGGSAW